MLRTRRFFHATGNLYRPHLTLPAMRQRQRRAFLLSSPALQRRLPDCFMKLSVCPAANPCTPSPAGGLRRLYRIVVVAREACPKFCCPTSIGVSASSIRNRGKVNTASGLNSMFIEDN